MERDSLNPLVTRREFVTTTSSALAATVLATCDLHAQVLPRTAATGSQAANAFLPERADLGVLQDLASRAVEAATRTGATYADIRFGDRQALLVWGYSADPDVMLQSTLSYGIRVLVNGAWAFVHGSVPSVDAVTASALQAVAMAHSYATLIGKPTALVPAPVVTGTWTTPIQRDPFTVPLRDQSALLHAYQQLQDRVRYSRLDTNNLRFTWTRETRVFASSEGSAVTQTLYAVDPFIAALCLFGPEEHYTHLRFSCIARSGGYETVGDPTQYETALQALLERVVAISRLPVRTLDVGRYPMVADGIAVGAMLGRSLGVALELDRVLGDEADASGSSYLQPPLELLGTEIANPALTVTATRAMPSRAAVKWDDEGVEPHDYPVITAGRLMDYHTSRLNAAVLQPWYEQHGQSVRSRGCAVATQAGDMLTVRAPHLRLSPGTASADLDTLCRTMGNGLLVIGTDIESVSTDQQFAAINLSTPSTGLTTGVVLQIDKGRAVARVQGHGLEMLTKKLWKQQLVALGDATTVQETDFPMDKGMPWQLATQSVSAPAALFKDVNLTVFRRPV